MKKNFILLLTILLVALGCSSDYEILKSQESISLTADSSVKIMGATITFTVRDSKGADQTENSVLYVDGVAIQGNTYTSATAGSHEVTADYFSVKSEPVMIYFHDGTEINFRKNMLMEDYTGTWCGWCPRVAFAVNQVHEQTEDAIAVAIHGPGTNPNDTGYDPYTFDTKNFEKDAGLAPGYPKGYLNRTTQWSFPEPDNIAQAIAFTQGENPKLGLAMNAAIANGGISLDVNVVFGKDFTNNLKLVVYVLENGLIYDQHNYTSYYDGAILPNYQHNHVLRACLTNMMGDAIDAGQTKFSGTFTKSFNVALPANITDAQKVEFVAFVIDETGKVVNVRKVAPGENQEMELL
jgi:thiol-disulfide isomerase/thioredoxin